MPAAFHVIGPKYRDDSDSGAVVSVLHSGNPSQQSSNVPSTRIAVRAERKVVFISAAEIVSIEAGGNYVFLHLKDGKHMLRQSITDVAEKLKSIGFVRINRSAIVNSAFVQEIQPLQTGDYLLRLAGGADYTVTRTYKNNLRLLAPMWLGPPFAGTVGS